MTRSGTRAPEAGGGQQGAEGELCDVCGDPLGAWKHLKFHCFVVNLFPLCDEGQRDDSTHAGSRVTGSTCQGPHRAPWWVTVNSSGVCSVSGQASRGSPAAQETGRSSLHSALRKPRLATLPCDWPEGPVSREAAGEGPRTGCRGTWTLLLPEAELTPETVVRLSPEMEERLAAEPWVPPWYHPPPSPEPWSGPERSPG